MLCCCFVVLFLICLGVVGVGVVVDLKFFCLRVLLILDFFKFGGCVIGIWFVFVGYCGWVVSVCLCCFCVVLGVCGGGVGCFGFWCFCVNGCCLLFWVCVVVCCFCKLCGKSGCFSGFVWEFCVYLFF